MGSAPAPKPITQTSSFQMSPQQTKLFNLAMPYATQYAKSTPALYGGQTIANLAPNEIAGQQGAVAAATGTGTQLANNMATANNFLLDPSILSPGSNPALAAHGSAIANTMNQSLVEQVLPNLRAGATVAGGAYSGGNTRDQLAEGTATGRTQQEIGDALSSLYDTSYRSGLQAIQSGVSQAPATQAAQLFGPKVQAAIGAQERATTQAGLDEAQKRFYLEQQLPFLRAQELMGLVSGMPGGTSIGTVTPSMPQTDPMQQILGTGLGLAGLMMGK
jgi:hypothetical protein